MSVTFTDIFCGAGGSSIGLTAAGFELRLAANHWDRAIETHAANFPNADHLCADVNNYDMRRLPKTDVLWASPICTEMSPAGRRTRRTPGRVRGQMDLMEAFGHVPAPAYERTRATFHDVIRATEVRHYSAVLVENVADVATEWELFDWWVQGMTTLGYRVQYVSVSSAHIGGPGNPYAPQWRDRLYLAFTRNGIPMPDVAPRPLAFCGTCDTDVQAFQSWKKPGARQIGKYRRQYLYCCPNTTCRHAVVEPYVRPASSAIDWTNIGQRIGDRTKSLARNTIRRIEAGLAMFSDPFYVKNHGAMTDPRFMSKLLTGQPLGTDTASEHRGLVVPPFMVNCNHDNLRAYPVGRQPLPARTTRIGDGVVVPPMMVPCGGTWNNTSAPVDNPMRTRTVRDMEAIVTPEPFLTILRNNATARPLTEPMATITAGGNHHALVVPYYTTGKAKAASGPFATVTSRDRFALVTGQTIDVNDCHYRMVQPRESLRAQRFPDTYTVTGNQGEQTMQAGNAVSANVAQWLAGQIATVLGGSDNDGSDNGACFT